MSGFEKKTSTQDIGLDSLCFCLSAVGWTALFGMVFGSGLDSPVLQAVLGWTALLEAFLGSGLDSPSKTWVVGWKAQQVGQQNCFAMLVFSRAQAEVESSCPEKG